MKLAHIRPDLQHEIGGLLEVRLPGRIGIEPEIAQRGRENIVGGIQHVDAAIPELGKILRLEDDVPTIDPGVGAEDFLHRLDVVADAGRAPHVIGGVEITRIVRREPLRHHGPSIGEVRKLRLVELLEDICLDLALQEVGGGNHDVVARFARHQARFQRLVGVECIVDDVDAGFLGEMLQHVGRHIVRRIVEIDDPLIRLDRQRKRKQHQ